MRLFVTLILGSLLALAAPPAARAVDTEADDWKHRRLELKSHAHKLRSEIRAKIRKQAAELRRIPQQLRWKLREELRRKVDRPRIEIRRHRRGVVVV